PSAPTPRRLARRPTGSPPGGPARAPRRSRPPAAAGRTAWLPSPSRRLPGFLPTRQRHRPQLPDVPDDLPHGGVQERLPLLGGGQRGSPVDAGGAERGPPRHALQRTVRPV